MASAAASSVAAGDGAEEAAAAAAAASRNSPISLTTSSRPADEARCVSPASRLPPVWWMVV
jgi:hypothetical protein